MAAMDGDDQALENEGSVWDADFIHHVDTKTQVIVVKQEKTASIIGGRYLKGAVLGEGSYAKVKEMLDVLSLNRRAVKIVSDQRLKKIPGGKANVAREIELLQRLSHENVVKFIEVLYLPEKLKLYIVLEYCVCPLGELQKSSKDQKFPIKQAHDYLCQIVTGLEYLHSQRIIHKDIKPDNLLLSLDGFVRICDFGVAECLDLFSPDDSITMTQGSPVIQPPEAASGNATILGFKLDVWAVGVTLYYFVSGDYPFMGDTIFQLFEVIGRGEYRMPQGLSEPLEDLIRGVLQREPGDRLSVQQIKKHSWFTSSHALQKKEVLVSVPPLSDYEDDLLRSMTTVDPLVSLHRHNLPSCPVLLTEGHMLNFLRNSTQPSPGSPLMIQDGLFDAAAQTFAVTGVCSDSASLATGNSPNRRPSKTSGEQSHDESVAPSTARALSEDLMYGDLEAPASNASSRPSILQRLTPHLTKCQDENHSLNGSLSSLERGRLQGKFRRSASISSAPHPVLISCRPQLGHISADDTDLPRQHSSPAFRHRAFTSSDAVARSLNSSIKRLFRRSNTSASASVSQARGVDSNGQLPTHPAGETCADSPDAGNQSRNSQSPHNVPASGSISSSEGHLNASRRSSVDSYRQRNRQMLARPKGPVSPDVSSSSLRLLHPSNPPSPARISIGSRKGSVPSVSEALPHFPSGRSGAQTSMRRVLSTKEEDEDELSDVEPAPASARANAASASPPRSVQGTRKRHFAKRFRQAHCRQQ